MLMSSLYFSTNILNIVHTIAQLKNPAKRRAGREGRLFAVLNHPGPSVAVDRTSSKHPKQKNANASVPFRQDIKKDSISFA